MNDFSEQALIAVESLKEKALASPDGRVIVSAKTLVQSLDIIVQQQREITKAYRAGRIAQAEEDANWCGRQASALLHKSSIDDQFMRKAFAEAHNAIRANITKLKDEETK